MTTTSRWRLLLIQTGFVAMSLWLLLADLLPLQTVPRSWAGPDMLFCFALVWSVRRPDYVPLPLLAAVFLLADFLLQRPPGLAAALMLLAAADLQARRWALRDAGFVAEWTRASLLIVAVAVAGQVAQIVVLTDPPGLTLLLSQTLLTALAYPICVAISAGLLGVRMIAAGDSGARA